MPRSDRKRKAAASGVDYKNYYSVEGGALQCRFCETKTEDTSAADNHFFYYHTQVFPCLLCAYSAGLKAHLQKHHQRAHVPGENKELCKHCELAWFLPRGNGAKFHKEYCPAPLGKTEKLRKGWILDQKLGRICRERAGENENYEASIDECLKNLPLSDMKPFTAPPLCSPDANDEQTDNSSDGRLVATPASSASTQGTTFVLTSVEAAAIENLNQSATAVPRVPFSDKFRRLDNGDYISIVSGDTFHNRTAALNAYYRRKRSLVLPCLLCTCSFSTRDHLKRHHDLFHNQNMHKRVLCVYCKVTLYSELNALHADACAYFDGLLQPGWAWDAEARRFAREKIQDGEDIRLSAELCLRPSPNNPPNGFRSIAANSTTASASSSPLVTPPKPLESFHHFRHSSALSSPRHFDNSYSPDGPISQQSKTIHHEPNFQHQSSPTHSHLIDPTLLASPRSTSRRASESPATQVDHGAVHPERPPSQELPYDQWFDSVISASPRHSPSPSHSRSRSRSRSLTKRSVHLTPRQASRYSEVSHLSCCLSLYQI